MFILWRTGRFVTQKIGNSIGMSYVLEETGKRDSGYWSVMQGPTKSHEGWFIGLCIQSHQETTTYGGFISANPSYFLLPILRRVSAFCNTSNTGFLFTGTRST